MVVGGSGREHLFTLAEGRFRAEVDFETAARGYQRRQVDGYLTAVHRQLAELSRRAGEAEQRLAGREAEMALLEVEVARRDTSPATAPPSRWLGWRLERVLSLAEDEAERIRAEARAEAERVVADAAREAARVRADARREREDLRRQAARVHDRLAAMGQELERLNDERVDAAPADPGHPRQAA